MITLRALQDTDMWKPFFRWGAQPKGDPTQCSSSVACCAGIWVRGYHTSLLHLHMTEWAYMQLSTPKVPSKTRFFGAYSVTLQQGGRTQQPTARQLHPGPALPGLLDAPGEAAGLTFRHCPRGRVCVHTCVWVSTVHAFTRAFVCTSMCMCLCTHVCTYLCVCVHVWGFCLYRVMTPARRKIFNYQQFDLYQKNWFFKMIV